MHLIGYNTNKRQEQIKELRHMSEKQKARKKEKEKE